MLDFYYSNQQSSRINQGISTVYNAILSLKNQINLFGFSQDECVSIVNAIVKDYPELYYVNFNFVEYQSRTQATTIIFDYFDYDINLFEQKINELYETIDKRINSNSSDYEVIKAVYDAVVNHVTYDYDVINRYANIDKSSTDDLRTFINEYGYCFNMYGVIVEKRAVCMGIAHTIKYLLNHYRIETAFLECEHYGENCKEQTYPHSLNVVEINNELYYLDATKGKIEDVNMMRYDFFLVNNERVKDYYLIEEQFDCNYETIDYYKINKIVFNDIVKLRKYLNAASFERTKGNILFKYKGKLRKEYLERVIKENAGRSCGSLYELVGYVVIDNYGYCKIQKR